MIEGKQSAFFKFRDVSVAILFAPHIQHPSTLLPKWNLKISRAICIIETLNIVLWAGTKSWKIRNHVSCHSLVGRILYQIFCEEMYKWGNVVLKYLESHISSAPRFSLSFSTFFPGYKAFVGRRVEQERIRENVPWGGRMHKRDILMDGNFGGRCGSPCENSWMSFIMDSFRSPGATHCADSTIADNLEKWMHHYFLTKLEDAKWTPDKGSTTPPPSNNRTVYTQNRHAE